MNESEKFDCFSIVVTQDYDIMVHYFNQYGECIHTDNYVSDGTYRRFGERIAQAIALANERVGRVRRGDRDGNQR